MKSNMGSTDKAIRIVLALIAITLYFAGIITGTLAIIVLVVAGVFLATSLVGFCPLYSLFGISTCKKERSTSL